VIGEKQYECTNHLGNVLATVSDWKSGEDPMSLGAAQYYLPDVLSYSDYYPFGMQMPGRNASTGDYRYGYQGSEKDGEFNGEGNSYTTYYRQLHTRLGRWLSLDPEMSMLADQSPYSSSDNNPINKTDENGDCTTCPTYVIRENITTGRRGWNRIGRQRGVRIIRNGGVNGLVTNYYQSQTGAQPPSPARIRAVQRTVQRDKRNPFVANWPDNAEGNGRINNGTNNPATGNPVVRPSTRNNRPTRTNQAVQSNLNNGKNVNVTLEVRVRGLRRGESFTITMFDISGTITEVKTVTNLGRRRRNYNISEVIPTLPAGNGKPADAGANRAYVNSVDVDVNSNRARARYRVRSRTTIFGVKKRNK
jgi:RHS repeat-associated protein